jgi:endonuclease YncB( thermonuclease family)
MILTQIHAMAIALGRYLCLLMLFMLSIVSCAQSNHESELAKQKPQYVGRVIKVTDGDTLQLQLNNQDKIRVRLQFIDTPEMKQAFGAQAKKALSDKVLGKNVQLYQTSKDRYKRVLAIVMLDGKDINAAMLGEGYAWHYRHYAEKEQDPKAFEYYADLEAKARTAKRGLWQSPNPVAPWDFRHPTTR